MQAQVGNGLSTVKAMMTVMQEWNVSLDDIQQQYRNSPFYCRNWGLQARLADFQRLNTLPTLPDFSDWTGCDKVTISKRLSWNRFMFQTSYLNTLLPPYNPSKASTVWSKHLVMRRSIIGHFVAALLFASMLFWTSVDIFPSFGHIWR